MDLVTFVIPVAAHHAALAQRAIDSALAQTIHSDVVTAVDEDGIGAGAMRNLLLQTVQTPFTVFLDADDEVMPDFVERTIFKYKRGNYVYTHWLDDEGKFHEAPEESPGGVFARGQFHTITTLMPTALLRLAGGFDETLAGMEDVDLYLKLQTLGVCGVLCPEPLMVYNRKKGKRAKSIRVSGQYDEIVTLLEQRYQGKMRMCCGDIGKAMPAPANEPQAGDILVEALYAPAKMMGPVSRRVYPRTGNRRRLYVDPRDVAARPDWWQPVPELAAAAVAPDVETVLELASAALSRAVDDTPVGTVALDGIEVPPTDDEDDLPVEHEEYPTDADAELPTDEELVKRASTANRRRK